MTDITPKLSKKDAIAELWRRGNLSWKLKSNQKELYNMFYNSVHSVQTWLLSRRSGKTFSLALLSVEACVKTPNTIIKFVAPTKLQINNILRPIMKEVLKDCPSEFQPDYKKQDYIYYFPNGSEIQLAGSEGGHAEKLRGGSANIAIVDEAQDVTDLDNIIKSILLPTTLTTKGKVIISGTPPKNPDHDFIQFIEDAEMRGSLVKKTVYDNPMISKEDIDSLIEELGGITSEACRRELFCVDENTQIKTKNGYKKIKNIEIGEEVFTHRKRYRKVTNVFKNPLQDRKVYRVSGSNNMGLICTEGHKLFISTKSKKTKKLADSEWINVEDIDITKKTQLKYFKVPIDETITVSNYSPDLAYLIGWHLAEGHISNNSLVLSLNNNDPIEKINKISKEIWGKSYTPYRRGGSCFQAVLCSKEVCGFYRQFGLGAKNKKIPYELKTARDDIKISLLRGLFSGDGFYNIDAKRAGLTSISFNLISDTSDILNSIGIPHQINKIRDKGVSEILGRTVYIQNTYSIKIFGKNFEKFMELIFNLDVKEKSNRSRSFIKDGYLYSRIHKIEEIEYKKPIVYDIEVDEDHSYVGLHATIHNCEIIKDPTTSVIPEFTKELEKEIVKEWEKPAFFDTYEAMDLGFKDLTVILFGYFDFKADKIIIEDEICLNGTDLQLPKLVLQIKEREEKLWTNKLTNELKKPTARVSDINYIVTSEISRISHGEISFVPAKKDDKQAAINNLRVLIANKKVIIHPRCGTLVRHLRNVRWNKTGETKFARSPDDGHYDAVDALIYLVRSISYTKNPYPSTYGYNPNDLYIVDRSKFHGNTQVEQFKKIFNIKKR